MGNILNAILLPVFVCFVAFLCSMLLLMATARRFLGSHCNVTFTADFSFKTLHYYRNSDLIQLWTCFQNVLVRLIG